ncbi:hypothetical protein SC206_04175 [Rouxiella sp. T17]|uniref:hypothetical protein n=1 Tax=Rouxiella sp. T17 TaxID=3085684 RepID=UPI002FC7630A
MKANNLLAEYRQRPSATTKQALAEARIIEINAKLRDDSTKVIIEKPDCQTNQNT